MTETFVNGVMVAFAAGCVALGLMLASSAVTEAVVCNRVVRELTIAGQSDAITILAKAGTCSAK